MKTLYFITGSSGVGKTTAIKNIQKNYADKFEFFYFDSVGVPSQKEMIEKFGSGENWQKETTNNWVKQIKNSALKNKTAILDGQIRPTFIKAACEENDLNNYKIIIFDCEDEIREKRLIKRGNEELVNQDMRNWAKFLREQGRILSCDIIDTTNLNIDQTTQLLIEKLK